MSAAEKKKREFTQGSVRPNLIRRQWRWTSFGDL